MANESPDVWPQSLWCGAKRHFAFQSRAWKSRGDQLATRTPIVRGPFTLKQVQALLQAAMRSTYPARDVALLGLFLETGIRLSELEKLTWQDFRLEEPISSVWVFGQKEGLRQLPISPQLREALLRYKAATAQEPLALPSQAAPYRRNASVLVQHEPLGHHQPDRSQRLLAIPHLFKWLAQDSGIDPTSGSIAHRLRATWVKAYLSITPGDLAGLAALLKVSLQTAGRYQFDNRADRERIEIMLRHHPPTVTLPYVHQLPYPVRLGGFRSDTDQEHHD